MVNSFCSDEMLIFFLYRPSATWKKRRRHNCQVTLPNESSFCFLFFVVVVLLLLNVLFEILDPCIEHNVKCIDDQESRSPYCEYDKDDDDCDDELTPGWYKAKSPMVTHCPGLLGCGSIYPVWLNGIVHILIYKSMKNIYTSISHANERQI